MATITVRETYAVIMNRNHNAAFISSEIKSLVSLLSSKIGEITIVVEVIVIRNLKTNPFS